MNVTVCSMWRNSRSYVARTLNQFDHLADLLEARGDTIDFVFVIGGSDDDTDAWLARWPHHPLLVRREDNCPYYRSDNIPARWRHLAWVANGALENIPEEADIVLWVESDLRWNPSDLVVLIDATESLPVVAAANVRSDGEWYDTFGTRVNGERFGSAPPHHPCFDGNPMIVDSTGGCLAMRAPIARNTRNQPEDGYIGWCRDIGRLGFPITLDPSIKVVHP